MLTFLVHYTDDQTQTRQCSAECAAKEACCCCKCFCCTNCADKCYCDWAIRDYNEKLANLLGFGDVNYK